MRRGTAPAIEFGLELRKIRIEKNLTMRDVANKIGGAAATVSQIEKGKRALKKDKVNIWANALGINEKVFSTALVTI